MAIWLHVDPRSGIPIYMQLIGQIKHALEVGALGPGEQLPTVRELASELAIAPNTIVKAYNELQRRGLIESRPGKGTVVVGEAEDTARVRQLEAFAERLRSLVHDAAGLGLSEGILREQFEREVRQFFPELQRQGEQQ